MVELNSEPERETYAPEEGEVGSEDSQEQESSYVEQIEQSGEDVSSNAVADDQALQVAGNDNQALVPQDDFQLPKDAVVLPVTEESFKNGLAAAMESSAKWMAVWCTYMIKKYGARTFFKG